MGTDKTFAMAFYKAQLGAGYDLAKIDHIYINSHSRHVDAIKILVEQCMAAGYQLSLHKDLYTQLDTLPHINSVYSINHQEALNHIQAQTISLVIDIDAPGKQAKEIRRQAYAYKICHTTTLEMAQVMLTTMLHLKQHKAIDVYALSSFF